MICNTRLVKRRVLRVVEQKLTYSGVLGANVLKLVLTKV